jgi:hypothetical protein
VRCVEVARRHGFGRIEVANLNMAAITRIYTLDFAATRADCVRAITAAVKVGSKRAEMIAHHGMHMVSFLAGDRAEAGEHARRSLDLALQLGARRFEAESLAFIAQACQAEGARVEAERLLSKALAISRETGMHYVGALVLGLVARVSDQPAARAQALGEAEALLADGAVSHNYVWFYPEAIDLALEEEDWARAERHAAALESYMRAEPTPYTDFHVARARALAAYGCRQCEEMTRAELRRLRAVAAEAGLQRPLPAIDRALANW